MAIFHMSFSNISAGKGRSAIASAAYRSGEKLFDDKECRHYFYSRSVMPESFILIPKNAPAWASNREQLWNEVEKKDRKSNSRYAKEFNVALPIELSVDEQKTLLTKYVQKNLYRFLNFLLLNYSRKRQFWQYLSSLSSYLRKGFKFELDEKIRECAKM